jgi:autotransporter-associated beta strand protein
MQTSASTALSLLAALAGFLAALPLSAQTTITFEDGQPDYTDGHTTTAADPLTFTLADGAATQSGLIDGDGSLTKTGAGSLALTEANTYSGGTTITGGTLHFATADNFGTGNITLNGGGLRWAPDTVTDISSRLNPLGADGATFDTNANDVTFASALSGTGALIKSGDGLLALENDNTYTGGTTITGGAVQIGVGGTQGSVVGDILNNGSLTFNRSDATEHDGVISGSGSVTHAGTGTLALTGANTYEGGTSIIGGGLLQFTTDADLGTGNITLDDGGLKWAAGNTTDISARLNSIGSGGGGVSGARGTFNTNGNDVTFNTAVTGVAYAVLEKTGAGTLTLNGGSGSALDYRVSGGTLTFANGTYEGGALLVSDAGASDPSSAAPTAVVITGAGTSFGLIGGADLQVGNSNALSASLTIADGASFSTAGGIQIGSSSTAESTLTVTGGATASTWDAFVGGSSTGDSLLTVSGSGSTFDVVNNLFVGQGPGYELITGSSSMTISGGASASAELTVIGSGGALGANSLTLTGAGSKFTNKGTLLLIAEGASDNGTLNLGSVAGDAATAAGILDAESVIGGDGVAILQFNTTGTDLAPTYFTRDGTSTGTGVYIGGSLSVINTAGTTVLVGTNNYTGVTRINGGTLGVTEPGSLGSSSNAATNLVLNGGTLRYIGGEQSTDRLFQVGDTTAGVTGTLDASGTGALTFTNTGSVAYGTADQTRTLGLAGTNTDANTLAALIADNGTGAVSVVKSGAGTWVLANDNTYTGGTTIDGGTLEITGSLGAGAYSGAIANSGAFVISSPADQTLAGVISGTGSLTKTGTATLTLSATNTYAGGTTITGGLVNFATDANLGTGALTLDGGGLQWATGNQTDISTRLNALGAGGATFDTNDNNVTLASVLSGTGALTKTGTGTLTLSGTNTYTGVTTISNGQITLENAAALGTGSVNVESGAMLDASSHGFDLNRLGGAGTITSSGAYTASPTLDFTLATSLTGTASLTKTGAAALILSGTNTYSGGTVLNEGILGLGADDALGSGLLTINGGALRAVDSGRTLTNDITLNGDFTLGRLTNLSGAITLTHDVTITSDNPDSSDPTSSTLSGVISGAHSLTFAEGANPVGTLVLAGDNTYTGGTTITSGNVQIGDGGTQGSIVGNVLNNASLTFNRSDATTYAGVISGSGSVTQAGSGTLTLTGTNTYEGGTSVINEGMIEFSSDASLGTGNITLNEGGLKWATGNTTDISSRLNTIGRRGAVFDTNGNDVSFASAVSGEDFSDLIKTGAGTLTLSGATGADMDYIVTGGTLDFGTGVYQGGYLDIGVSYNSPDSPSYGPSAVILSGADTSFSSDSASAIGLSGGDEFSASLTISGGASFSSTGYGVYVGQNSAAESTLTITGAGSSYTGTGDLEIGSSNSGRSTLIVSDGASATTQVTILGSASTGENIITVSGTGSTFTTTDTLYIGYQQAYGQLTTHSSVMTVSDGASASAGTTVIGSGGAITANSLTLTGTGSTFTTGTLTLAAGALDNGTLNLGSAAGDTATAAGILDAATVTGGLGAAILQFNTTGTNLAPTYFTRDGTSTGTEVNIAGGIALVNTAGTTVLSGTNTYTGGTTITGGLINFTSLANFGTGNITLDGGGLQWGGVSQTDVSSRLNPLGAGGGVFDTQGNYVSLNSALSGTGALTKTGSGTLRLGATNTYSGGTSLNAGTLELSADNALGTGAVTITGGTLRASGAERTLSNALFTSGTFTVGRLTNFSGTTTLTADTTIIASNPDGPADSNMTFSGAIVGDFGLTLAEGDVPHGIGTGYIIFGGTNTYTGGTTLRTRLSIASDTALGAASGSLTMDGGTLRQTASINSSRDLILGAGGGTFEIGGFSSFSGTVSGSGGVTMSSGFLVLDGPLTYTGATVIDGGTLKFVNSGTGASTPATSGVTIGAAGALYFGDDVTYGGVIAGAGGVRHEFAGTTVLTGANTYTGGTTINGGALQLGNGGTTGSIAGDVALSNGGNLAFKRSDAVTYAGVVSGNGSLTQSGAGTLTLSGTNTYTGGTTVNAGLINFTSLANFGTGNLALNGGGLQWATGTTTDVSARLDVLGANGATFDTNGNNVSLNTVLTGTGALTKTGAGTLRLGAANTYTGGTFVSEGTLGLGAHNAIGTGAITITGGGIRAEGQARTLSNALFTSGTITVGRSTTFAGVTTLNADTTLIASNPDGPANSNTTFSGAIGGNFGVTLAEGAGGLGIGTGYVVFSGTNTYTGGTTLRTRLSIASDAALGAASGNLAMDGGTLRGTAAIDSARNVSLGAGGGTFDLGSDSSLSGTVSGSGALTKSGAGTLTLTGANTYAGVTTLSGGALQIGNGGTTGSIAGNIVDNGSLVFNRSNALLYSGNISGTGSVTQSGSGTLTLSGTHTYTGATTVNAGTLRVTGSLASSAVNVASGATLGGSGTIGGFTTLASGAHLAPGSSPGTITFTAGLALSGGAILDFQLGTASDLILVTGGTLSGPSSGTITVNLSDSGGFTAGTYTLIDATGASLSSIGATSFDLGTTIAGYTYTFAQNGDLFQLIATASPVPEPSTCAALAGLGALGLVTLRRRRRQA